MAVNWPDNIGHIPGYQEFFNQDVTIWSLVLDFGPTHWERKYYFLFCLTHCQAVFLGLLVANLSLYGKVTVVGGKKVTKNEVVGEKKPLEHFIFYWSIIA